VTFERARACYVHRFTIEHVPEWATKPFSTGRYPGPQYRSDAEWFALTLFPPNNPLGRKVTDCYSSGQTWPLGTSLEKPFSLAAFELQGGKWDAILVSKIVPPKREENKNA
jgi:hypothetical protein